MAYSELLAVFEKYHDVIDSDIDIRSTIKQKIQAIGISENFGIAIPKYNSHGDGYYKIFDNAHIAKYGSMHNRTVS